MDIQGLMRRRRQVGRKPKAKSKVNKALQIAKKNRCDLRILHEPDNSTIIKTSTVLDATPAITNVTGLGDGSKVRFNSFRIRGVIKQNLASAIIDDYRIDIVMDRHPGAVQITPALYLGAATPTIDAFKNFDSKERYKILRTIRGHLSSSEGSNSFREIDEYIRLNVLQETNTDGNFAVTKLTKNALYIVHWTTSTANQPTFNYTHQLVMSEA